jgi:large subunit ribosomal protein L1
MAKLTKKRKQINEMTRPGVALPLAEALALVKKCATSKFDETVELILALNVDPRKADQAVRGVVRLPNGTGKSVRVAVFARGAKAEEAQKAGAEFVGADDLADRIIAGEMAFERCIATPDMMGVVGKLGKVLGPKGLMPNPKLGTVTMDIAQAVEAAKGGQIEYRVEKAGIVHAGVGKASFGLEALAENIKALIGTIVKARPSGVKGTFVKKVSVSSTMGPGFTVDQGALLAEVVGPKV